jgi:hypothetical protein
MFHSTSCLFYRYFSRLIFVIIAMSILTIGNVPLDFVSNSMLRTYIFDVMSSRHYSHSTLCFIGCCPCTYDIVFHLTSYPVRCLTLRYVLSTLCPTYYPVRHNILPTFGPSAFCPFDALSFDVSRESKNRLVLSHSSPVILLAVLRLGGPLSLPAARRDPEGKCRHRPPHHRKGSCPIRSGYLVSI